MNDRYNYSKGSVVTFHGDYYVVIESRPTDSMPKLAIIPIDHNNVTTYVSPEDIDDVKIFSSTIKEFIETLLYRSQDVLNARHTKPWWETAQIAADLEEE